MAEKHLGLPFDIHGGGADLKFPHHENEIAQSCCAHGCGDDLAKYVKYWVHNGFVTVEGEKMSKSLGNVQLAHDLLEQYKGPVLRLALLSAQYSKPLDWTQQRLQEAEKLYDKIANILRALDGVEIDPSVTDVDEGILEALCDDLNTPLAFVHLNEFLGRIKLCVVGSGIPDTTLVVHKSILHNSLRVLGLEVRPAMAVADVQESDPEIDALLAERAQAKAEKDWARADEIRDQLVAQGIEIEDTPDGVKWRKVS